MKVHFAARVFSVAILLASSSLAVGQEPAKKAPVSKGEDRAMLEKELWNADQQWLCSSGAGPYHQDYKECIEFRNQYWTSQFFELSPEGQVQTKRQMIAAQRAAHPSPGVGPYPDDFKLMAVYGNFALATDHTRLKRQSAGGKISEIDVRVLRMFAKENGKWRPAGAALVPIQK
jgi:ketosteroid isomerase-like protein